MTVKCLAPGFLFLLCAVIPNITNAQSDEQVFKRLGWLNGSWRGIGFESIDPSGKTNTALREQKFELTYDSELRQLTLSGKSKWTISLAENLEYVSLNDHYKDAVSLEVYFIDPEEKQLNKKLALNWISKDYITFSLVYNRRPMDTNFIASGTLQRSR